MSISFGKAAAGGFALLLSAALGACASVDTGIDRIESAPVLDPAVLKTLSDTGFEAGEFRAKNGVRIPYRWLAPNDVDPDERYPLVVVMHSSGQIGDDNAAQLNGFARAWASPEIRTRYRLGASSSVQHSLTALQREDLVARDDDGHYVAVDSLFREWVARKTY